VTAPTNEQLLDGHLAETGRRGGRFGARIGSAISRALGNAAPADGGASGGSGGAAGARFAARFLRLDVRERAVRLPAGAAQAEREVRTVLETVGEPQPPAPGGPPLRTLVGAFPHNAAVVEARVEDEGESAVVHLRACAREGLIKQRSAEKALDDVERGLGSA
jgi:hypothetical protein